jgi:uncharacterized protein (TIGR01244 family)
MNPGNCTLFTLILLSLMLGGCNQRRAAGPQISTGHPVEGEARVFVASDVYFAPQLDAEAFQRMAERGVRTVINLRSVNEMSELARDTSGEPDGKPGFDEPAALRNLGMHYVHIPLGGDDGYEPADVDAFTAAITASQGPVLVHCQSGARARTMWQAYLVRERGYSLNEAVEITRTVGDQPYPIERLLGRRLHQKPVEALQPSP